MSKPKNDFKLVVLGLFGWGFILLGAIVLFCRCVSYQDRPLSKPSQEQLAPQEGDDILINEKDGIDVGMLREALEAQANVEMLEKNAEEDKQYYVDVIDEANQRIVLVSIASGAVIVLLLIFK